MAGTISRTGHIPCLQKLMTLSLKLLKIRGSNRSLGKSGRNCGKEPSRRPAFPLNHKWLHQPTCHLRLRHLSCKCLKGFYVRDVVDLEVEPRVHKMIHKCGLAGSFVVIAGPLATTHRATTDYLSQGSQVAPERQIRNPLPGHLKSRDLASAQ